MGQLLVTQGIDRATTPLFALATGGMRSRRTLAVGNDARLTAFHDLEAAIKDYIEAKAVGVNSFLSAMFGVAEGDDEAMYGWITANYALGRLDNAPPGLGQALPPNQATKGFLEMGGASLQVAYEARANHAGRHMAFAINYRGFNRAFKVYTREIDNLGARAARTRYVADRITALGHAFAFDRCWPRDNNLGLLNPHTTVVGTGLRDAVAAGDGVYLGQLCHSLLPVRALLPQPFLEAGHPDVHPAIEFVGGATYWYLSQGIYPVGVVPAHSFSRQEMMNLIMAFARLPWATHDANVQAAAAAKVGGMTDARVQVKVPGDGNVAAKRVALTAQEVVENTVHKRALLFNAMLVFATLYLGVKIRGNAMFQPYDGVIGLNALTAAAKVPYSWTLGRAVVHAISSAVPVTVVRTPLS